MRRLPLVASFLLFILLCASIAYWAMQLFKPPLRPVAAPPRAAQAEIRPQAAAALFGARSRAAAASSNYQLRGVIFSGNPRDSVAIISADGKPAQAIRVDSEIVPGVTVKEVHRGYVLIAEGGATKRLELPEDAPSQAISTAGATPSPALPPVQRTPIPMPSLPAPTRAQTAAAGGQVPQIGPTGGLPNGPGTQQQQQGQQPAAPVPGQAPMGNATAPPPSVGFVPPQPGAVPTPGTEGLAPPPPPAQNPAVQGQGAQQ
ncbi:MAG TPA: type II secretion system protein N [Noviherbaspirillum sp.]|jgi:general secretion pathway protein C|uniref:type II secretion system protein N n=1 Tax=Noviherbaspirillum sp. TaxID=1926288 RepID=UPI002F948547